jgi:indole-3-glycerol phosphate synthase
MILDDIAESTRKRVAEAKERLPLSALCERAERMPAPLPPPDRFEKALAAPGISFICEVKKASPSKGLIAKDFPYLQIARDYEAAGASAISVLTEPLFFQGSPDYLCEIAKTVSLPVLRKDFIIDEYQIYEAKLLGASAVLLICALLGEKQLAEYIVLAEKLGLAALVEAHTEDELRAALGCGARITGVNNRDLKTFTVDLSISFRLRRLVPKDILFVAESGIKTPDDIKALSDYGVDAVLIGEAMMKADDKKHYLATLKKSLPII